MCATRLGKLEDAADCFEFFFKYIQKSDDFNLNELKYLSAVAASYYLGFYGDVNSIIDKSELINKANNANISLNHVRENFKKLYGVLSESIGSE